MPRLGCGRLARLLGFGHAGEDVLDDGGGVFGAGVVGGDDADVGEARGGLSHERAFPAVAVPAGAEDDEEAAFGDFAQRIEHVFDGIGRMRVVDEVGRGRGFDAHHLQAAADGFGGGEGVERHAGRDAVQQGGGKGTERVVDVVATQQAEAHLRGAAGIVETEFAAEAGEALVREAHIGIGRGAIGKRGGAAIGLDRVEKAAAVGAVEVDGGGEARGDEELALGLEVCLHRAVVVEVVLREVREGDGREARALDATLRDGVRGDLHHGGLAAVVAHLREEGLQFERTRRGVVRGDLLRLDGCPAEEAEKGRRRQGRRCDVGDRRDEAGGDAAVVENLPEERGGRRLAVGPRHAEHVDRGRGVAVGSAGEGGDLPARVLDGAPGDAVGHAFGRTGKFGDDLRRAGFDGGGDEARSVVRGAAHGDEGVAWLDATRVALQRGGVHLFPAPSPFEVMKR